ncbi:TetR/AcrR family transcriptional regulator [Hymenobacter terrenus]|uniref:TetR/AcrR family transcriptional regulator n=1 Tax=Hymenobacter terrenus TaxID=1629124 RepID=UPI0006984A09|nr:TetR/AcrR family transcriptional regulator [Hymenobacter terrenus]
MAKRPDRRSTILTAAAACFARFGYTKTTLEDIGQAVQLNKASLYYYFPGKEELFMAVVLEESARFQATLAEQVRQLPTPAAQVSHYLVERLRYYGRVLAQNQLPLATLQALEPRFEELYAEVLEREIASVAELLTPLLSSPGSPEPRRVARLLLTAVDAVKHDAVRRRNATHNLLPTLDLQTAEEDTRLLADLLLAGLAHQP